ncbi:ArnT family glycosyltransferase [Novosphingobium resinovorum]|uniref:ArnT family glycosyltransferase n=1 Tax=Novosphingobium resinovorum TaxID=158500 RepID=UPI0009F26336|nr:glycosyltransferase family 39 protein [Novosphingobium resinovorum]
MVARSAAAAQRNVPIAVRRPIGARLRLGSLALYLPIAFALRLLMLGKPAFQSDEQFYLLVGQRMAQGALPYVDIWDRKPWGLFALYRAVYALRFDPVLTYQLLGLACSVLTALVIERIARRIAPPRAAQWAGLVYLLWQPVFNVALGQSPVFYNLPVALAALIVVDVRTRAHDPLLARRGLEAMLLFGLAMQIKYTAVFEGAAFGLMLLGRGWADGWPPRRLVLAGAGWIAAALAPTAAVWTGYAWLGHGDAFVQANFTSILGRTTDMADAFGRLAKECLALIPFALALLLAPHRLRPVRGERPAALPSLRIWALASIGGFLVFGTWYDHYLGPVLVPLSVLAAPALARSRPGERWYGQLLLGMGVVDAIAVPALQVRERGDATQFASMTHAITRELHGRCLYVFEGDSALYRTTNACIPTRFAYPSHLNAMNEAGALNIDPVSEVRRIMASRPGVVVVGLSKRPNRANDKTRDIVMEALRSDYQTYTQVSLGTRRFALWRLK